MKRINLTLFTLLLFASFGAAQSLGDVARKERERREKNKKDGAKILQFDEKEVFGDDGEPEDSAETDTEGVDEAAPAAPDVSDAELEAVASQASQDPAARRRDTEAEDRRFQEAEWRAKFAQARKRVTNAEQRRRTLGELHLAQGEYYVDENNNVVIESLDHLRQLVREADAEIVAAKQALDDLTREARRSGVPPGWLR